MLKCYFLWDTGNKIRSEIHLFISISFDFIPILHVYYTSGFIYSYVSQKHAIDIYIMLFGLDTVQNKFL